MDALFQGTKVTVRNLLSLIKGACGHARESPIANRVRGVACAGDTSFSPPCLFLKQPYLASSERCERSEQATIAGAPRCKAREELRLLREKLSSKGVRVSEQKKEAKKI